VRADRIDQAEIVEEDGVDRLLVRHPQVVRLEEDVDR